MSCKRRVPKICEFCGSAYEVILSRQHRSKYCNKHCMGRALSEKWNNTPAEKRPGYKGGSYITKRDQRTYIYQGNRKFIAQYRKNAEIALGRQLKRTEVVHHINGDPADDRNSNLLICDQPYHKWLHESMSKLYMQEHFAPNNLLGGLH